MTGRTDMVVGFWNHQFTHVPIGLAVLGAEANRSGGPAVEQRARFHRSAEEYVLTNRTKIVATVGPASRSPPMLRRLIEAGVNVFRLNFSHGTHDEHSAVLADIRAVSRDMDRHVAVLQDLCGPKMRLEAIPGDVVECRLNDEFTLVTEPTIDHGAGADVLVSRAAERPQGREKRCCSPTARSR